MSAGLSHVCTSMCIDFYASSAPAVAHRLGFRLWGRTAKPQPWIKPAFACTEIPEVPVSYLLKDGRPSVGMCVREVSRKENSYRIASDEDGLLTRCFSCRASSWYHTEGKTPDQYYEEQKYKPGTSLL